MRLPGNFFWTTSISPDQWTKSLIWSSNRVQVETCSSASLDANVLPHSIYDSTSPKIKKKYVFSKWDFLLKSSIFWCFSAMAHFASFCNNWTSFGHFWSFLVLYKVSSELICWNLEFDFCCCCCWSCVCLGFSAILASFWQYSKIFWAFFDRF